MPTVPEMIEFQRFREQERVGEVTDVLDEAGVPYRLGTTRGVFEITAIGRGGSEGGEVIVSVPEDRFAEAQAVMEREYLKVPLPEGHYLRELTDEELAEVVGKAAEWSPYDVAHAKRLIDERGIDMQAIERKREERLRKLQHGKRAPAYSLWTGWFLTFGGIFFGYGLLGSFTAMLIGWSLWSMKERTPEGVFPTFDRWSREMGKVMLLLAAIVFVALLALMLSVRLFGDY